MATTRNSYTVEKKLVVIGMTAHASLVWVSKRTRIPVSCICKWRQAREHLESHHNSKARKIGCGRQLTLTQEEESRIKAVVLERRSRFEHVSMRDVSLIARDTFPNASITFSMTWVSAFCKRNRLSWRRVTSYTVRSRRNAAEQANHEQSLLAFNERTRQPSTMEFNW
jgi:hypothetical protein